MTDKQTGGLSRTPTCDLPSSGHPVSHKVMGGGQLGGWGVRGVQLLGGSGFGTVQLHSHSSDHVAINFSYILLR